MKIEDDFGRGQLIAVAICIVLFVIVMTQPRVRMWMQGHLTCKENCLDEGRP